MALWRLQVSNGHRSNDVSGAVGSDPPPAHVHDPNAGVSMGGLHAAISACFMPYPVGVASYLGPTSAAPVFTKGVLANACEWKALVSQATHRQLEQCLREFEHKVRFVVAHHRTVTPLTSAAVSRCR